jgi:MerR family mercuric resistance operon transcriptional regulator
MGASYTISRFALAAEVHVETVRYYQRRGLLPEPEKALGSIRRYSDEDVEQLRFIKRAQAIGFSLEEVAMLLALRTDVCCSATRALASEKIAVIEERIASLTQLRGELAEWIAECDSNPDDATCPVIERLASMA